MRSILAEEGFEKDQSVGPIWSGRIDLSYSLDELRRNLKQKWRKHLKIAERNQLEIIEGVDDDLAEVFLRLYREMRRRKDSPQIPDIAYFRDVQRDLPDPLKMRILICKHLGDPVAGLVVSLMGSSALDVFAATGEKGLDLRGSYLLHWRMLEALKAKNFRWYDLAGINHETHPGTAQFKAGLAGKLGCEIDYVGQFKACESTMSNLLVKMGEQLRATYGVVKWRLSQGRGS